MKTIHLYFIALFLAGGLNLPTPANAATAEPVPLRFEFSAHSFGRLLRDLVVERPGENATRFFVPNRGFTVPLDFNGFEGQQIVIRRKGAAPSAPPVCTIPVSLQWQGQRVFLFLDGRSGAEGTVSAFPVVLKDSEYVGGNVFFANFTRAQLAVKLGENTFTSEPASTRLALSAGQDGAVETALFEMEGEEWNFLYRNTLRLDEGRLLFLFVLLPQEGASNYSMLMTWAQIQ